MSLNIAKETHDHATLEAQGDTVVFSGELDSPNPGQFLTPFLSQVADQMGDKVRLDFSKLDFLNSSGIKCLVSFVLEKPPEAKVIFITDSAKTWQKTSFEVIQSLDEDSVLIEEVSS